MTNMAPKLGALALSNSDCPATATVFLTPLLCETMPSIRRITSLGPLGRCRIGQLHVDQKIAHVLRGNKTLGDLHKAVVRESQQPAVDQNAMTLTRNNPPTMRV